MLRLLPLLLSVCVLVVVIHTTMGDEGDDFRATLMHSLNTYGDQAAQRYSDYSNVVERRLNESLRRMFDQLDKNGDGFIEMSEFKGLSLNVLAAVRSIELPELPKIDPYPQMPTVAGSFSFVRRVIVIQFLFLVCMFIAEHVRVIFFSPPLHVNMDPIQWENAKAPFADVTEALRYDTPLTLYERLKIAFFLLSGVFFLRLFMVIAFLGLGVLCVNLSVVGGRRRDVNTLWCSFFHFWTRVFGYLALASMGFYHIRVRGQRATRAEAKIFVANHVCVAEVIALFLLGDLPAFVSRVENLTLPLFRGLVTATEAIVVDRDAASSRTKTLQEIARRANDPNAAQLMIFPEGTCSNQRTLFTFKKGAFEPGVPVQLVCFKYPYNHFNAAWTGRPCGGNDAFDLLLRLLCQFVNRMEVRFLPVYHPTDLEREDPVAYASHCQTVMANVVGAKVSDATFADYVAAAKRYNRGHVINSDSNTPAPVHSQDDVADHLKSD